MNKTCKVIKDHRSIRNFNEKQITDEQINEIINCSLRAASAGNMMLYSIIKVTDKKKLKYLSEKCDYQSFIATSSVALIYLVDSHKFYEYFKIRGIKNARPSIVDFTLGIQDAMIAAQNAVVAAESMSIGTCYIGDIMENYEEIKAFLNLPQNVVPVTMVVFGNYDSKPQLRERFNEKYVVFDDIYPNITEPFLDEMFAEKESNHIDFANTFYNRKINSPFYVEMMRSIKLFIAEWDIDKFTVTVVDNHRGEGVFKTFEKHTTVKLIADCQHYINWIKCEIEDILTYVPKCFVTDNKLNRDYNPTELICEIGQSIEVIEIVYGWIYGKNRDTNEIGWIPCEKVSG